MKDFLNSSMPLINTLLTILNVFPIQKICKYKYYIKKLILYSIFFIFLISSYIFGCIALYFYLANYWGEVLAAFSLSLLLLIISSGFIIIDKLIRSKKKPSSHQLFSHLEKYVDHIPNSQDFVKALKKTSPSVLIIVLGTVALATYVIASKKKD